MTCVTRNQTILDEGQNLKHMCSCFLLLVCFKVMGRGKKGKVVHSAPKQAKQHNTKCDKLL
jgi:hypothetical protein